MAVPACDGADDPGPARRPDPGAPGWVHVQQAVITGTRAVVLAVQEMTRRPGDDAAREMTGSAIAVLESLGEIAARCTVDEAVLAEQRQRGFDEGAAACKAARCRLQVIGGGR